jgi:hypothetical protein
VLSCFEVGVAALIDVEMALFGEHIAGGLFSDEVGDGIGVELLVLVVGVEFGDGEEERAGGAAKHF